MKSIIIKSLPLMAALLLPLASCQDEPEVGSTLYPESPENYDAKLYINETALPGNQTSLEVVQTPVSLLIPQDEISFYVRITKPVTTDVTVSVTENPQIAEAYLSDAEALPEGSLKFGNTSVTIKAGSMMSEQPITAQVVESDAVRNLTTTGVAAITLTSNSANIATGSNNNAYYVVINKKVTNFKGQSVSELASLNLIPHSQFQATVDGYDATDLADGNSSTEFWYWNPGGYDIIFSFEEATPVKALGYFYASYSGYCPNVVEILTSDDGETWTSQTGGKVTTSIVPSKISDVVPFEFYSAITCHYVMLRLYSCFWTSYGASYDWPAVSDVNLYN
ncbi:MAG: BT_3987 domain-containing protein [Muribaculaceae bacterium]